jgi:hypothetical protein
MGWEGSGVKVLPIQSYETEPWLLKKHYAKRFPPISFAFGLYEENVLVGVCTYGMPSSATLREGIAGAENAKFVLELNRLCIESSNKNAASFLVGRSLRLLPKPLIIVSYADTAQNHVGYVYQACNFIYTGLSAKRTDWKVKGMEHLHSQTIVDMSKNMDGSRVEFMRKKFGDDFYLLERSRKHRYIYITGKNKALVNAIKYTQQPYPKGDSRRYDAGGVVATQELLFI